MKIRLTYKELSIFAGIVVAVIVILLLWINQYTPLAHEAAFTAPTSENLLEQIKSITNFVKYY